MAAGSSDLPSGQKLATILLRSEDELRSMNVELLYQHSVTAVDVKAKRLIVEGKPDLRYDELLLATGSGARKLSVPGHDLQNVFTIRAPQEAAAVTQALEELHGAAHVVIVGTGFIGLEVAAFLGGKKELAKSVTVVGMEDVPLKLQLGVVVGRGLQKKHEAAGGIQFQLSADVESFTGEHGKVTAVKLKGGATLPAHVVIVAVGAQIQTDWLKGSGVELTERGEVLVDRFYQNTASGLYAAGDIARFPYFAQDDALIRVEHWAVAQQMGRAAALSMLYGRSMQPVAYVPYFWTVHYKLSIRYCGYGGSYDDVLLDGQPEDLNFIAVYCKGEKVLAVASCQRDPAVSQAAELIRLGKMPSKSQIKTAKFVFDSFF